MAKRKKILIVDDEEDFTRLVKMNLESTGNYEVRMENQGARGLEAARAFGPDLILLDFVMPDMLGPNVACEIKADKRFKDIPILFLTSTVRTEKIESIGGIVGGYRFLDKPIKTKDLITGIQELLS